MQIVIDIPNKDIPKYEEVIDVPFHFIDGKVCRVGGYGFVELPKGHGRLGDLDIILNKAMKHREFYMEADDSSYCRGKLHAYESYVEEVKNIPIIIEADTESEECR